MTAVPLARRAASESAARAPRPRREPRAALPALVGSLLAAGLVLSAIAGSASAASAAPSGSPPIGTITELVAWLDTAIPTDARPGDTVTIGLRPDRWQSSGIT